MAYMCKYSQKECDACGKCWPQAEPCPECGSMDYEEKYTRDGKMIGCDWCIKREVM